MQTRGESCRCCLSCIESNREKTSSRDRAIAFSESWVALVVVRTSNVALKKVFCRRLDIYMCCAPCQNTLRTNGASAHRYRHHVHGPRQLLCKQEREKKRIQILHTPHSRTGFFPFRAEVNPFDVLFVSFLLIISQKPLDFFYSLFPACALRV